MEQQYSVSSSPLEHGYSRLVQTPPGSIMYFIIGLLWLQAKLYSAQNGWSGSSNYPYLAAYYDDNSLNAENCPGFVCPKSGLSQVGVKLILNKENANRARYTTEHHVSNMYKVYWSNFYADFAKVKAQQCLPPTVDVSYETYYIYDHNSLMQIYTEDNPVVLDEPVAVQVVIGSRIMPTKDTSSRIMFESNMPDVYMEMFSIARTNATLRGSTTQMGCGYVYMNNKTHLMDFMVCLYGLVYLEPKQFEFKYINSYCSECNFYLDKPVDPQIENYADEMWGCDLADTVLCTDLKRVRQYIQDSLYQCDSPTLGLPKYPPIASLNRDKDKDEDDDDDPFRKKKKPPEVHPYPCIVVFIPLVIVIILLFLLFIYIILQIIAIPQKYSKEAK